MEAQGWNGSETNSDWTVNWAVTTWVTTRKNKEAYNQHSHSFQRLIPSMQPVNSKKIKKINREKKAKEIFKKNKETSGHFYDHLLIFSFFLLFLLLPLHLNLFSYTFGSVRRRLKRHPHECNQLLADNSRDCPLIYSIIINSNIWCWTSPDEKNTKFLWNPNGYFNLIFDSLLQLDSIIHRLHGSSWEFRSLFWCDYFPNDFRLTKHLQNVINVERWFIISLAVHSWVVNSRFDLPFKNQTSKSGIFLHGRCWANKMAAGDTAT